MVATGYNYVNCYIFFLLFFFFQAEDGIRDWSVTGVQTCALPILRTSGVSIESWPCYYTFKGCALTEVPVILGKTTPNYT